MEANRPRGQDEHESKLAEPAIEPAANAKRKEEREEVKGELREENEESVPVQLVQVDEPVDVLIDPAAQSKHVVALLKGLKRPAGQSRHWYCPLTSTY